LFVREISFLHPLCATAGTAFAWAGWRSLRNPNGHVDRQ
jgi:hypothetical protein